MPKEPMPKPDAFMRAFYQSGNIGQHKLTLIIVDNA
jgi:hypothetical protein